MKIVGLAVIVYGLIYFMNTTPKYNRVNEGFYGGVARGSGHPDCLRTLPEGAQGLRVKGKSMLMGDIQIGNKAKLYSGADPFTNDGWVRLMKADGSAAYSGGNGEGFAANNLYSQQDTIVNRNLIVNGVAYDKSDQIMLRNVYWGSGGGGGGASQCLSGDGTNITTKSCDRNDATQYWTYKGVRFAHVSSGKCMSITANSESYNQNGVTKFGLTPCDLANGDQVFRWDQYTRRIRRWKNNFGVRGDQWITQVRLQSNKNLDLWEDRCGDDCVWDAY
jgi:hypothetical protein